MKQEKLPRSPQQLPTEQEVQQARELMASLDALTPQQLALIEWALCPRCCWNRRSAVGLCLRCQAS